MAASATSGQGARKAARPAAAFRRAAAALALLAAASLPCAAEERPAFCRIVAERQTVYEREVFQLVLEIHCASPNLDSQINTSQWPPETQLRVYDFEELAGAKRTIGSREYFVRRYRAKARAVAPGTVTIRPVLNGRIVRVVRQFIFMQQEERPISIPVDPLVLTVRPLPEAGRPDDFSGAVGAIEFDASAHPADVAVGDIVRVTITVSGEADLSRIRSPALAAAADFKVYEPKLTSKEDDAGTRVFEQVVVPLSTNGVAVPALRFSWFDPRIGAYRSAVRGPFPLRFHAERQVEIPVYAPARQPGRAPAPAERPELMPVPAGLAAGGRPPVPGRLPAPLAALQAVPLAAVAAAWFLAGPGSRRRRREAEAGRTAAAAPPEVQRLLQEAEAAASAGSSRIFYETVWNLLAGYFSAVFGLAAGEVSAAAIGERLRGAGAAAGTLDALDRVCAACERQRFAAGGLPGGASAAAAMAGTLDSLKQLLAACGRMDRPGRRKR